MDVLALISLVLVALTLGIVLWNVVAWPEVSPTVVDTPGAISVLIPARNEAANITACVDAALAAGTSVGEVLVYDDRSDDRTAELVRAHAARDARVRLI